MLNINHTFLGFHTLKRLIIFSYGRIWTFGIWDRWNPRLVSWSPVLYGPGMDWTDTNGHNIGALCMLESTCFHTITALTTILSPHLSPSAYSTIYFSSATMQTPSLRYFRVFYHWCLRVAQVCMMWLHTMECKMSRLTICTIRLTISLSSSVNIFITNIPINPAAQYSANTDHWLLPTCCNFLQLC